MDETFRAVTKVGDHHTRFVDAFENTLITNAENGVDWQRELKKRLLLQRTVNPYFWR
ncbi:MAG TPA: hypothetical protein VIR31_01910 [Nitrososphaeraceae archaeon]